MIPLPLLLAFHIWAKIPPAVRNECVLSETLSKHQLFLGFLIPELSGTLKAGILPFPKLLQLFPHLSPLLRAELS